MPPEVRERVKLRRGGVGGAAAQRAAQELITQSRATVLISTGFSGALAPGLDAGAIVLGARVLACRDPQAPLAGEPLEADAAWLEHAHQTLVSKSMAHRSGTLVTVAEPVFTGAGKRALGAALNALAVDMEAAAIARVARQAKIPFFAVRTISDTVEDDLPEQVGSFLTESGEVRVGQVAKFVLRDPRRVGALMRLKRGSDAASNGLMAAWRALLTAMPSLP